MKYQSVIFELICRLNDLKSTIFDQNYCKLNLLYAAARDLLLWILQCVKFFNLQPTVNVQRLKKDWAGIDLHQREEIGTSLSHLHAR